MRVSIHVHLIALDFSKAFDTVRHSYLAEQLAEMPIPDNVYNWIIAFLEDRSHATNFNGEISFTIKINCSIVQGSGLGPIDFIITISKFRPCHSGNRIQKYADDTYLLIPSSNSATIPAELDHVTQWSVTCNLKINSNKTYEMIVRGPGWRAGGGSDPIETPGLTRVSSLKVLGVILSNNLSFNIHIDKICCRARQSLYAFRALAAHGLAGRKLYDVVRATTLSRLLYAAPAWWGYAGQQEKGRLQAMINRLIRQHYLPGDNPTFEELCRHADTRLFSAVLTRPGHVLHELLPPAKQTGHNLRPRHHDRVLPRTDNQMRKTFVTRMLFTY